MATLNSITEDIAFSMGEQFNDTLRQSIKDDIVEHRAMLIRQDLDRNTLSYTDYLQTFCVALEEVNKSECPELPVNAIVLRSKEQLPKPLRLKYNGRSNFKYVGSVDRSTIFTFSTGQEQKYVQNLPFQQKVIYYTITNNYLIILNNLKLCKVLVEGIIADPRKIDDCDFPDVFPDDIEFPIPVDMLVKIKTFIKKQYPSYIKDGEETTLNTDDRP